MGCGWLLHRCFFDACTQQSPEVKCSCCPQPLFGPVGTDAQSVSLSQYISRPLLIEGYKFDLRCYVLVASCTPLRLFFYRDGFVRMATEKYESPSADNHSNMCLHLTNYSINKKSAKFVADTNAEGM